MTTTMTTEQNAKRIWQQVQYTNNEIMVWHCKQTAIDKVIHSMWPTTGQAHANQHHNFGCNSSSRADQPATEPRVYWEGTLQSFSVAEP